MAALGFIKKAGCWSHTLEHFGYCGEEEKACWGVSPIAIFFSAMDTNSLLSWNVRLNTCQDLTEGVPQNYLFLVFEKEKVSTRPYFMSHFSISHFWWGSQAELYIIFNQQLPQQEFTISQAKTDGYIYDFGYFKFQYFSVKLHFHLDVYEFRYLI